MRMTREVTRVDLIKARRIYSQLDDSERKNTNSRELAQALANIQWAIDKAAMDFEAHFALAGN